MKTYYCVNPETEVGVNILSLDEGQTIRDPSGADINGPALLTIVHGEDGTSALYTGSDAFEIIQKFFLDLGFFPRPTEESPLDVTYFGPITEDMAMADRKKMIDRIRKRQEFAENNPNIHESAAVSGSCGENDGEIQH